MITRPYILHALSPLHAGTGQSAELIDLPIARLKGSGIPYLPGSSIKGVLRDAATPRDGQPSPKVSVVFGPTENPGEHAGALICADARLLALPVRSFRGTFAFVTSPLLLALAARDLDQPPDIPKVPDGCCIAGPVLAENGKVYLEDLDLDATPTDSAITAWQQRLGAAYASRDDERQVFTNRLAIVDDETMTFLWETATQLDQRVRIDEKTRTVAEGALWLEESLPPESLLIGLLIGEPSRKRDSDMSPEDVLDFALPKERILQFGGKSTVGRGRCRMVPL